MTFLKMLFPGGREKALTLSYDDGVVQDKRLIAILDKNGIKATFNLNSGWYASEEAVYPEEMIKRRLTYREATETYLNSAHEVAVHGVNHPWLEQLPEGVAAYEMGEDRKNLEKQFRRIVCGMAYPFGTYSDAVILAAKSCGIVYGRGAVSSHNFSLPCDWFRWMPTCHHDDPKLMDLAKRFVEGTDKWSPSLFYVWGHSNEFDEKNNWNVMEEFASYVGNREHIWYATNIEIHDYVDAYRKLRFSSDFERVNNPTALTVWFQWKEQVYRVAPGETLELDS